MKMIVVAALALVAVVAAAPVQEEPVQIVRSESVLSPEGGFQYSWEGANGIRQAATGELKQVAGEDNKPVNVLIQRGSYSYPNEEGKPIAIEWIADENGFQAVGESIPKAVSRR